MCLLFSREHLVGHRSWHYPGKPPCPRPIPRDRSYISSLSPCPAPSPAQQKAFGTREPRYGPPLQKTNFLPYRPRMSRPFDLLDLPCQAPIMPPTVLPPRNPRLYTRRVVRAIGTCGALGAGQGALHSGFGRTRGKASARRTTCRDPTEGEIPCRVRGRVA